jgi:hypothetical protein
MAKASAKKSARKGPYVIQPGDFYDGERVRLPSGKYIDRPFVDPVRAAFKAKLVKQASDKDKES